MNCEQKEGKIINERKEKKQEGKKQEGKIVSYKESNYIQQLSKVIQYERRDNNN